MTYPSKTVRVGEHYGYLTVIRIDKHPIVQCNCGSEPFTTKHWNLKVGKRQMCLQCAYRLPLGGRKPKYPKAISLLKDSYRRWQLKWNMMHQRCYDSEHKSFANYGGRGIRVCRRWHDFEKFAEDIVKIPFWDIAFQLGLEMDRINNDGDYKPGNVRIVTPLVNQHNKRYNGNRYTERGTA